MGDSRVATRKWQVRISVWYIIVLVVGVTSGRSFLARLILLYASCVLSESHFTRSYNHELLTLFFIVHPHAGGESLHLHPSGQLSHPSLLTLSEKMAEMRMVLHTVTSSRKRPA